MPYDAGYAVIVDECWPNGKTRHKKWDDGEEHWYDEIGARHNVNGPAVIYPTGSVFGAEYWVNGVFFKGINSDEELMIKLLLE